MSSDATRPTDPGTGKSALVAAVWLVLGVFWMGLIAAVGALIHEAIAGVWLVSDVALLIAVGWWMMRARRTPMKVVALAWWWFLASLAGPAPLILFLPWFRTSRERSLAWIEKVISAEARARRARRWRDLIGALPDPRRPWRLTLLLGASIAMFPFFWLVTMIFLALGSTGEVTDEDSLTMQRFAVGVGAFFSAVAATATILDWIAARRRYPPNDRGSFRTPMAAICGAAVLVALVAAVLFGKWAWATVLI